MITQFSFPCRRPILLLFFSFWALLAQAQAPNYDSTFTALFTQKDDSARTDKLFFLFNDMYLYEPEETAAKYLPFAKRMLEEANQKKNPYSIAKANQALAYLYKNTRQFEKAFAHCTSAEKEWNRSQNFSGIAELKYFRAAMMIGNRPQEEVVTLGEEALAICKEHHLNKLYIDVAGFLAPNYGKMGNYNRAIELSREMLTIPGITPRRKLGVYNDLGVANELAGRFKEAKEAYLASLSIHRELGLPTGSVIGNLSSLAFTEKKLDEAIEFGLQAQKALEASGPLEHLFNNSELLSKIYTARGDYKKALDFSKLAYQLNDSLHTLERQSEYLDLEKKYQTELKNKTIAEQKGKIEKEQQEKRILLGGIGGLLVISVMAGALFYLNRKRKESQLQQEISESEMKALRAQMNPHFMFNSLNAIQQMVMNGENDDAYQYLDAYARLTRQILENSEKKWITVREEIRFLELYLQIESLRFGHTFQFTLEISDDVMPNSDKLPAMVVQPIIENALKHGLLPKKSDKRLRIFFDRKEDGPLEIVVEDNGVGRAASGAVPKDSDHHSMSLGITENRLRLLDSGKGSRMETEDLFAEDGLPAGTRVTLFIFQVV